MAQVFLSYARRDLSNLQPLLQSLEAHGITVWRDQNNLYGGQQWPKAIGEAIAAHDVLLLVWSQGAATSHFVELEWNTALALQTMLGFKSFDTAQETLAGIELIAPFGITHLYVDGWGGPLVAILIQARTRWGNANTSHSGHVPNA
jgi:hypothetical protein